MLLKVYLFFITPIMLFSFIGTNDMAGFFNIALSLIGLLGAYLYAFNKRILSQRLWKLFCVIYISYDFIYNIILYPRLYGEPFGIDSVIGLIFFMPIYITASLYAFKKVKIQK